MPQVAGDRPILLRNFDGRDVKTRELEGIGEVHVPHGIPLIVSCPINSPLVVYKELRIALIAEWVESRTFPGYAYESKRLRDNWIERDDADLEGLDAALAKMRNGR